MAVQKDGGDIKVPVANVVIGEEEARAVYDVVKSGWLSMGRQVKAFEEAFAARVDAKRAIACNSGTAALHTALVALDIGPGDEVIIPDITFISTPNCVEYQGAVPVIAEVDPKTYNITAEEVERRITSRTKAVIPVDMNGMPFDYDELEAVCREHGLHVVADSAESLGATYKERKIGGISRVHMFSFFPNKTITTGEGGMITTDDESLADRMFKIHHQGQDYRYHHVMLGYNYRMTEMQAALGAAQLKHRADYILGEKERMRKIYDEAFNGHPLINVPYVPSYVTRHSWYMYTVSLDDSVDRDEVVDRLSERGIDTRLSFPPVHIQPYYVEKYGYRDGDYPVSLKAWRQLINLPMWPGLPPDHQEYVCGRLIEIMDKCTA